MVLDNLQTFMDRLLGCGHCPGAEVHAQGQGGHVVGQDDRRSEAEGEAASLEPSTPLTSGAAYLRGRHAFHAFQMPDQRAWVIPQDLDVPDIKNQVGKHR